MPKKLTYEFVNKLFEDDGYILSSKEYISAHTKLEYICPEGHQNSMTWANWQQGARCPDCAGNKKLTREFIKQDFEEKDYTLSSKEYLGAHTKLDYICPAGHQNSMTWANWITGYRCPDCAGNMKLTHKFVKSKFEKNNYILSSKEYINSNTKLYYVCPKGHEGSMRWDDWQQGVRCSKCSYADGSSNFEKEVKQFILSLTKDFIENDRTTIKGSKGWFLELDILFPCKTKAIECNGIYWHDRPEVIERDKIKQDKCKEKGIKLLTITDEEWYNDRKKCEKIIMDFISY